MINTDFLGKDDELMQTVWENGELLHIFWEIGQLVQIKQAQMTN